MKAELYDKIQTSLLIILSISAAFLMLLLWYNPPKKAYNLIGQEPKLAVEDFTSLIEIDIVLLSNQSGKQVYYDDIGDFFADSAHKLGKGLTKTEQITAISKADYQKMYRGNFIEYSFLNPLSSRQFAEILSGEKQNEDYPFVKIDKLLINEDLSNYIYIENDNQYFMVESEHFSEINFAKVATIKGVEAEKINGIYLPSEPLYSFKVIDVTPKIDLDDEREVKILARKIFSSQLDFVQELIDVYGAKVMLYGYGEKALRISPEGKVYYRQNIDARAKSKPDFLTDLSLALGIINKLIVNQQNLYLSDVRFVDENGASGFKFHFSYRINDYLVTNAKNDTGISVTILDGQLKSIDYYLMESKAMQLKSAKRSVIKIVEESGLAGIQSVQALYVQTGNSLLPAYCLASNDKLFYYNALDYSLLYQESK